MKIILTIFGLSLVLICKSQWLSIDTIYFWPGVCSPTLAPFNTGVVSSDTVFFYLNISQCSPSTYSQNEIYLTKNSFHSYNGIFSLNNSSDGMINIISFPNGHTCFLYYKYFGHYFLSKWTSTGGWSNIFNCPYSYFNDIKFIDENNGFATSDSGVLYKYKNDTLDTLTIISSCFNPKLYISNTDTNFIICKNTSSGNTNTLLRSVDNGLNWSQIYQNTTLIFSYLKKINNKYLLVSSTREVYESSDYGITWNSIFTIPSNISSYTITSDSTIFGLQTGGNIVKSTDRCLSWNILQNVSQYHVNYITMLNDSIGYAFGYYYSGMEGRPIILKTVNGGITFSENNLSNNSLNIFPNPNAGKCTITIPEEFINETKLTLQIIDNTGHLLQQSPAEMMQDKISVNITAEARGMYTAVLSNGVKSYTGKIIFE